LKNLELIYYIPSYILSADKNYDVDKGIDVDYSNQTEVLIINKDIIVNFIENIE